MLGKKYLVSLTDSSHGLNSLLLGTELNLSLSPHLLLVLGIENNLFTFGAGQLAANTYFGFKPYLFQAYTGFRLNFERLARKDRQDL
jgi:hypothetical protein